MREKKVKRHYTCRCGYNEVSDTTTVITVNELKAAGFKKRKYRTGGTFYFISLETLCDHCEFLEMHRHEIMID
jgi:hypothetical protein